MTFGAPMVVYATDPVKLYDNLQRLEAYAEQQAGEAHPPLQFHNFVNGELAPGSKYISVQTPVRSHYSADRGGRCTVHQRDVCSLS